MPRSAGDIGLAYREASLRSKPAIALLHSAFASIISKGELEAHRTTRARYLR